MPQPQGPPPATIRTVQLAAGLLGLLVTGAIAISAALVVATLALADRLEGTRGDVAGVEGRIAILQASADEAEVLMADVQKLVDAGRALTAERDALREREGTLIAVIDASRRVESELRSQVDGVSTRQTAVEIRLREREAEVITLEADAAARARETQALALRYVAADRALAEAQDQLQRLSADLAYQRTLADAWQQACVNPGIGGHRSCVDEVEQRMEEFRAAYVSCALQGDRPWIQTLTRGAEAPEAWPTIRNRTHLALCNPDLTDT